MPICPRGHESQAEDWCDFCGFPMTPPPGLPVPGASGLAGGSGFPSSPAAAPGAGFGAPRVPPAPPGPPGVPDVTAGLVTCPICRTPQTGRYCEECGYDFDLAAPPRPQTPTVGAGYGYPQPVQPPAPYQQPPVQPATPYQQPNPYEQPQQPVSFEKAAQAPAAHLAGFPEPDGYEPSGPVYAQPGPTAPGDEFGTSFRLAPPVATPPPPPQPVRTTWIAVVSADRDYFTDMMARSGPEAAGLFFPPYCPDRRIPLTGRGQLRIGRRSQHRGTVPEIDLSVPPEDPGASHQHAVLAEQADGSWVLVDQDSTNGTTVNGGTDPVPPHTAIPLNDGDRIHIGAWTTITMHRA